MTPAAEKHPMHRSAVGVATIILALVALGCGGDETPVYVDDLVEEFVPITTLVVVPATTAAPPPELPSVEVTRAWSPANATAELTGTGAVDTDIVTVDDVPTTPDSFTVDDSGAFVMRVRIDDEGAHTVCVRDTCSRVYTLAADAESVEEVEAKIADARVVATSIFDGEALFPDWSIVVAGALSGTGGSTDAESQTITVYANRDRSVDEYAITILHEWGHVVDAVLLDDDERVEYSALRGFDPATPWRTEVAHTFDEWGGQPSEDFAEVMVALWTADTELAHEVRTFPAAGQPDQTVFDEVTRLVSS